MESLHEKLETVTRLSGEGKMLLVPARLVECLFETLDRSIAAINAEMLVLENERKEVKRNERQ